MRIAAVLLGFAFVLSAQKLNIALNEASIGSLKPGQFIWKPELSKTGPMVLLVSIPEQRAFVYRNGVAIGASTVSTGKQGHETPTGVFTILQKDAKHHSNLYNNAPMPYMERLTWGGVALHAGNLPGYPASHGCVRMPLEFAKLLFFETSMGTTVVVAGEKSQQAQLTHPGILAPVNPQGQVELADVAVTWEPEKSPTGPVSLVVSGADKMAYVFRNGVLIGSSKIQIQDPEQELGEAVFTRLEGSSEEQSKFVAGQTAYRWMSMSREAKTLRQTQIAGRIRVAGEFAAKVYGLLEAGSTIVVTDGSADPSRRSDTGFTILDSGTH